MTFEVVVRNYHGQAIVDIYQVYNCRDEQHAKQKFMRKTSSFAYGKGNRDKYTFEFRSIYK